MRKEWQGFKGTKWQDEVDVREFIQNNYTPYDGDESFMAEPTQATEKLWGALQKLQKEERAKGGVLDMETEIVSSLTSYGPGYIDESMKDLEQIVGLQTDKPLKRAFMPYGGVKRHVPHMVINQVRNYMKFLQNIIKLITMRYLVHIRRKCVPHDAIRSSQDFQIHMGVDVSLVIIAVLHYMELII